MEVAGFDVNDRAGLARVVREAVVASSIAWVERAGSLPTLAPPPEVSQVGASSQPSMLDTSSKRP